MENVQPRVGKDTPAGQKEQILSLLLHEVEMATGICGNQIDLNANLFQMGLDSLMLTRFRGAIKKVFDVEIRMKHFYAETDTIHKLVGVIHEKMPPGHRMAAEMPAPMPPQGETPATPDRMDRNGTSTGGASALERVITMQMDLMSRQLDLLKNAPAKGRARKERPLTEPACADEPPTAPVGDRPAHEAVDFRAIKLVKDELNPRQTEFVDRFLARYTRRTRKSKALIKAHRPVFSDWINSLGFRFSLKEVMYPIYANRSQGARLWDVDGNEYIDIAMGYGVNYLGHRPPFVTEAVEKQLRKGYHLGPQFALTNQVAALICELTGVERVAFCNTGSEAVMTAMRLARTVTGRDVIALFDGSYHGNFDGILAIPTPRGPSPMAPGTPDKMVADVMILNYGDPKSLEAIRTHAGTLAGVLVEPVQTRNPSLRPKTFLKQLREITREAGIALIFDEIVNGFRLVQGGAQAFFDVRADIVTYGKMLGGGIPASVVAGKATFLDAIDGGPWDYNDASVPEKGVTFFAGTFCKHPLAMAAMHAVLTHIKTRGPRLQEAVNARTARFADTLNAFFEQENVSVRIRHCASFFLFTSFGKFDPRIQSITMDLMFYLLMEKGVYTWERRICYFSTVHTDEDVETIIRAVKESVAELRAGGFAFGPDSGGRKAAGQRAPASSVQKRMYALSQLEGADVAYHVVGATWIDGKLDTHRLENGFQRLIRRHASLRTGFVFKDAKLWRRVSPSADFRITHVEVAENGVDQFLKAAITPFDLSRPPLLRVWLVRTSENRHLLLFDAHHIVADGVSSNIVARELIHYYESEERLPAPGQYEAYVRWERDYLASDDFKTDEAFWLGCFADQPPVLDLATDYPRPPEQRFSGDNVWFKATQRTTSALKEAARENGASLFMVLLAAYYVLLHRLTGREDIVVGIPTAGREKGPFENTIGMFVNTLAMRERLAAGDGFTDFLASLKRSILKAYDHQYYPFDALMERLSPKRDASRNPLFDVMFAFENADERGMRALGLTFTPVDFKPAAAMADLTLEAVAADGGITLRFEFCTALFKRETIERWSAYYLNILEEIAQHPAARLCEIDFIPAPEKGRLVTGWNDTDATWPTDACIHHLFEKQVEKDPNHVALVFDNARITYGELNQGANRTAHYLRERGVAANGVIAVMMDRSPELFFSLLGILKAGGAYLPVNPALPEERIRFMLSDCACKVMLTHGKYRDRISAPGLKVVEPSRVLEAGAVSHPAAPARPRDLAYVLYTSGSTGTPKGCLITHANVVRLMINDRHPFDFNADDTWIMAHACTFDFSVWEMYGALLYGGTLVVPRTDQVRDAARFLDLIRAHRVSVLNQTPGAFYNLIAEALKQPAADLDAHLRWVIFGGDRLEPRHLAAWTDRYGLDTIALVNMYGITETTVHVTFHRLTDADIQDPVGVSPIGRPIPTTTLYLLDKQMGLVPTGVRGEIYVGGGGVGRGYLNRPELTARRFVENPFQPGETLYRSGDLARRLPDGRLLYLGRNDDQVQVRGFRVEPGEVEKQLLSRPGIEKAVVVARSVAGGHHRELVAYLVKTEGEKDTDLTVSSLREHLAQRIPDYMIPAHFVSMGALPLTGNGKIDRTALPDPLADGTAILKPGADYRAPGDAVERCLAAAWEAVLGKADIGAADNFFDLGGDSIKALQIVARLNRDNLVLQPRDLFHHPTIASLAPVVTHRHRPAEQGTVDGEAPPTAIQARFFEHYGKKGHHFTQAVLLRAKGRLDGDTLAAAVEHLLTHHDALRMRCRFDVGGVVLENPARPAPGSFGAVDLSAADDPEDRLQAYAAELAAGMDLTTGPLFKAVHFCMTGGDRLLIVIHHLVVDGVSWRILMEDLNALYTGQVTDRMPTLPPKTDAFIHWARRISEFADKATLLKQIPYWRSVATAATAPLPRDAEPATNRVGDERTLFCRLDRQRSRRLLGGMRAPGASVEALLLTALARALKNWHGAGSTLIALEGHGREPLFDDLDISRTVGWFTSLYPFVLELAATDDPGRQINHVATGLGRVPQRGVGWGILAHLASSEKREGLDPRREPRLVFNHLGSFDAAGDKGPLTLDPRPVAGGVGPDLERAVDLEIESVIVAQRLRLSITFNPGAHLEKTVQALLDDFHGELCLLIDHCTPRQANSPVPGDLTFAALSEDELQHLMARSGVAPDNLADVYPLSPMQEGMLFHTLHEKTRTAYFQQFSFTVAGALDAAAFEASWNELVGRHAVLRTAFVHDGADRPLQVVRRNGRVDFRQVDLSGLEEAARQARRDRFKQEDRRRPFDPARDVLLRVGVLRLDDNTHEIVWSHHHLLMDGWCMGIVFDELFALYAAFRADKPLPLEPAPAYREYIRWLEARDPQIDLAHWRRYLAGYGRLATLPGAGPSHEDGFAPVVLEHVLSTADTNGLEGLARRHRVTVNAVVQTLWGVLLSRYNRVDDVVFGAAVSGRPPDLPGVERMVGLFLNTIPVRVRIDAAPTFMDLAVVTQRTFVDAQDHHHVALADIQAASRLKRGLFDHVVVFENYPLSGALKSLEARHATGLTTGPVQEAGRTNYDFTLEVYHADTVRFKLKYNARVHGKASMTGIRDDLARLLAAVVEAPASSPREIRDILVSTAQQSEREDFVRAALAIDEAF